MHWFLTHKGDARCRALADRHYSRQHPGHPMFCRPGYNQVLWTADARGEAVWVWFRPKWESGIKGTERKDRLRAVECTLFRNESNLLSSLLIVEACQVLLTWEWLTEDWPDGAITGINTDATKRGRSQRSAAGACYRHAGWSEFEHRASDRADVWLRLMPHEFPEACLPRKDGRIMTKSTGMGYIPARKRRQAGLPDGVGPPPYADPDAPARIVAEHLEDGLIGNKPVPHLHAGTPLPAAGKSASRTDTLPLVSEFNQAHMDRAIRMLQDDRAYAEQERALKDERKRIKAELDELLRVYDVPGVRYGTLACYWQAGRRSLSKTKLVELGVPADTVEAAYTDGKPFLRIVDTVADDRDED